MMPGRISFLASVIALGDYLVNVLLVNLVSILTRGLMIVVSTLRSFEYKVRSDGSHVITLICHFSRITESVQMESVAAEELVVRSGRRL